jgi:hypothetical protein
MDGMKTTFRPFKDAWTYRYNPANGVPREYLIDLNMSANGEVRVTVTNEFGQSATVIGTVEPETYWNRNGHLSTRYIARSGNWTDDDFATGPQRAAYFVASHAIDNLTNPRYPVL